MTSETKYGVWNPAESPVTVEYSLAVIEELRAMVSEAFQRIGRGGLEVGGILCGSHDGNTVRVDSLLHIRCEHAFGPSFRLSEKDKEKLREQLVDPSVSAVGWFVSHPRTELALQPTDIDLFNEFFPELWQLALVIRPGRASLMRAGFFVRQPDGSLRAGRSYLDFNFADRGGPERWATMAAGSAPGGGSHTRVPETPRAGFYPGSRTVGLPTQSLTDRPATHRGNDFPIPGQQRISEGAPSEQEQGLVLFRHFGEPLPEGMQPRAAWKRWALWAAVATLAALIGYAGFRPSQKKPDPLALEVLDRDGQLRIQWNRSSGSLADATGGSLEMKDGDSRKSFQLSTQDLIQGSYAYKRQTGYVEVRLTVDRPGRDKIIEASHFVGSDPAPDNILESLTPQLATGEAQELARLRRENAEQRARIGQLERTLVILRSRLGAE